MVYADVDNIMSIFSRNTFSSVSVRLQSPADFAAFRDAVSANPALHLEAQRESQVVEEGFKSLNAILNFVSSSARSWRSAQRWAPSTPCMRSSTRESSRLADGFRRRRRELFVVPRGKMPDFGEFIIKVKH